ncbi:MAG TPA: hypothetical protein PLM98_05670 [Thiolinea sp.]|nr:hypothetical protein [Thiolinea sp.]
MSSIKNITYTSENGNTYKGFCVRKGVTKIRQIVVFEGKYITDGQTYSKTEQASMDSVAQQILWELVNGRTLAARQYVEGVNF